MPETNEPTVTGLVEKTEVTTSAVIAQPQPEPDTDQSDPDPGQDASTRLPG